MSGKNNLCALSSLKERKGLSDWVQWIVNELERIDKDNKKESASTSHYISKLLTHAVTRLADSIMALTDEELIEFWKKIEEMWENEQANTLAMLLLNFSRMEEDYKGKSILLADDLLKSLF